MLILSLLISLSGLVAGLPSPIMSAPSSLDTNNPALSNPTSPPSNISFPARPDNPYPSGVPVQPDVCDGSNPSADCFNALDSNGGGYIWFDKDSTCSADDKDKVATAIWDANTLAFYSSNFPNQGSGTRGSANGIYWMGPDYATQQSRISGNLKRVYSFKTSETSTKTYITISCKDTKNQCGKVIDGKAVGGYAWTYNGWFGYYHYITFCPVYFTLEDMSTKLSQVEQELSKGDTTMATKMDWLRTTGQFFLHEMMHTRIADGGVEPHITDEFVAPNAKTGDPSPMAYGAKYVHLLAKRQLKNGGGVTRASTNADSYAILASASWWWDTTGYFPDISTKPVAISSTDSSTELIFPNLILGNISDPTTADYTSLFAVADAQYNDTVPDDSIDDPDFGASDASSSSMSSSTVAPTTTTAAPTTSATPADTCSIKYDFLYDAFQIYGKDFDAANIGTDGSNLKSTMRGCGDVTGWSFETLTNDPNGYQWHAKFNLNIGQKDCVGNKLKNFGGSADACAGSGI